MSRLLVTGATGMLGSYVARAALDVGWEVRALVRDPVTGAWLERWGVECVPGDLLDAGSVGEAARGCDAVAHAAAAIGPGSDATRFRLGNVQGSRHVVAAAARAGARLVHVSSTAVLGESRWVRPPTDETAPLPDLPDWDAYGRSKQEAEGVVLGAAARGLAWATVVRPPVMYGRRDRQLVPRLAPVARLGVALLPGGGRTTLPVVHAGSVAAGILAALDHDEARGRVYHLTDDAPLTARILFTAAGRGLGRPSRPVRLPVWAAGIGFAGLAAVLRASGRADLARRAGGTLRMLTRPNPFSSRRARAELGWDPRLDPAEAVEDAFRWWRTEGPGSEAS